LLSSLFGLFAGILIGAVAFAFWHRKRDSGMMDIVRAQYARERLDLEQRIEREMSENSTRTEQTRLLSADLAREQQKTQGLQEKLDAQKTELEELQVRMTTEFENIANRLLTQRGKELQEQQSEKLGTILKPLQERIVEFQTQVRDAYEKEGRERFALKDQIEKLVTQNTRLTQEADNLTKALKGDSQSQGAWGEMILEKLLDSSGLIKGQEYSMQESTTLSDGSRLRPDAVIMLPENKHLIIDAKVSLLHYERYASSNETDERDKFLKQHVDSIRTHAKGLGEKNYTKLYGVDSVDFVLMFVPIEPAFLTAIRERPEIFQEAYDRQVVMVTHSTLMATLRTIHGIWKNERIARNHLKIAERAGALYDKFHGFTEDLGRIGKSVNDAQKSYEAAVGKLSEGPGNLIRQVEKLKELGAKTNKTIHPKLLERSMSGTSNLIE
ncbi:MAG TPA: DNA recombination protein RmuC, partial [Flavobacteriales bacterium]|nr:DNA recombination protein RmuC [Flavobacteriales bacterium]